MATSQIRGNTQIMSDTILNAQINSAAAIASSKLADGANWIKKDGSVAMTASFNAGSNTIINVTSPSNPTDAANRQYVDNAIQGLTQKPTARVATTAGLAAYTYANGTSGLGATLTGNANNTQLTIDGVTLVVGDVILIKNETSGSAKYNGLYTVTQLGSAGTPFIFTRHVDMDSATEFSGGFIPVDNEGSSNANTLWLINYVAAFTVGTTAVAFSQLASPSSYVSGNGITISTLTISVDAGNGLTFSGSSLIISIQDASLEFSGGAIRVTHGTSGQVYVANGSGVCTPVTLSNDVSSVSSAGAVTLDVTKIMKFARYVNMETPSGTVNGSNATFTLANTPVSGTVTLFFNGIAQEAGAGNDYTISGGTLTMLNVPQGTDKLRATYWF